MLRFLLYFSWAALAKLLSAQPAIDWQINLGGSGSDRATKLCPTEDGGLFAVGHTNSTDGDITSSYGDLDAWIVRLDHMGALLWEISLGGSGYDAGHDILATEDGGCVVLIETQSSDGMVTNPLGAVDCWIVKLSSMGELEWETTVGGSDVDIPRNIVSGANGGYVIAAQTASPELPGFHPPGSDYYVAIIGTDGELVEQRCFGGSGSEGAWAMTRTQGGLTITCGTTRSGDGDVVGNLAVGVPTIWVLAVDDDLNIQWQRLLYSSNGSAQAYSIVENTSGMILVTGSTSGSTGDVIQTFGDFDIWVVSLGSNGALLNSSSFGGSEFDSSRSIVSNSIGGSYLAGSTRSNDGLLVQNNGQSDGWVLSIAADLSLSWQRTMGGSMIDRFFGATILQDNGLVVAGSSISSDGDLNMNYGLEDLWMVKFKPQTVGIAEQANTIDLRLAPNPVQDVLQVTWSSDVDRLTIHDALGKLIHTRNALRGEQQLELALGSWAAGVYTVRLYGEKSSGVHRFIKQ